MGVEIFFVLSGFIIPYAMRRSGYTFPGDVGRFIVKRLVRLDPPYLLSSAIAGVLSYLAWKTPGFRGEVPQLSWAASLAHLGYLNGILKQPWYNAVCWTLGIVASLLVAVVFWRFVELPSQRLAAKISFRRIEDVFIKSDPGAAPL